MADSMVNTGFSVCSAGAGDRIMENDGVLGLSKAANPVLHSGLKFA